MESPSPSPSPSQQPSSILLSLSLLMAMITCSSAGVVFRILTSRGVPPALAASWRLWCQELVLTVPFLVSYRQAKAKDCLVELSKDWNNSLSLLDEGGGEEGTSDSGSDHFRLSESGANVDNNSDSVTTTTTTTTILLIPKWKKSLPLMFASGFFLGVHFLAWVYSIEKTSLAHSLLWVSMGPIILNWGQWMLYLCGVVLSFSFLPLVDRPTKLETIGAAIGLLGAILMLLDVTSHPSTTTSSSINIDPTLEGDIAAFLGAFAVSLYLLIGRRLRSWMPLWLYAFPVIGSAVATTVVFAFLNPNDPAIWGGMRRNSIFGFWNREFVWLALYLGAGPGVCGHTVLNALLKYISPLTISTAMLSEPLLGSLLGYMLHMQSSPGMYTWMGGLILLIGLFLIVKGEDSPKEAIGGQETEFLPSKEMPLRTFGDDKVSYGSDFTEERSQIESKDRVR